MLEIGNKMKDGIWGFHAPLPQAEGESHPVLVGTRNSGAIIPREVIGREEVEGMKVKRWEELTEM